MDARQVQVGTRRGDEVGQRHRTRLQVVAAGHQIGGHFLVGDADGHPDLLDRLAHHGDPVREGIVHAWKCSHSTRGQVPPPGIVVAVVHRSPGEQRVPGHERRGVGATQREHVQVGAVVEQHHGGRRSDRHVIGGDLVAVRAG